MRKLDAGTVIGALLTMCAACSPSAPAAPPAAQTKAAVQNVLYEDGHIRFVEYTLYPGANTLEALPYHSVMMADAAWPQVAEAVASGASPAAAETNSKTVFPFDHRTYPQCRVETPRAAKTVTVSGGFPQHYYRVEYKRLDGKDYAANWKTWYPDVFAPPAEVREAPLELSVVIPTLNEAGNVEPLLELQAALVAIGPCDGTPDIAAVTLQPHRRPVLERGADEERSLGRQIGKARRLSLPVLFDRRRQHDLDPFGAPPVPQGDHRQFPN